MEIRRISWQGSSRARWLRERMEQRLTRWWGGWFSEGEDLLELQLASKSPSSHQLATLQWCSLRHQNQHFMVGMPRELSDTLAARALHLHESPACTVVEGVATACRDDLVASLWGEGAHDRLSDDETPLSWTLDPRYGGLLFQLEIVSARVWVWVNRAWCEANGPEVQAGPSSVLTDRRAALAGAAVRLHAHIDLGQISLSDSLGWSVGDVLLTDIPRLARVELSTDRGPVASGLLGQADASRHVTLI